MWKITFTYVTLVVRQIYLAIAPIDYCIQFMTTLAIYFLRFITDLSLSEGFDGILIIVDRFMKIVHFIPCLKSITSKETFNLVLREVF